MPAVSPAWQSTFLNCFRKIPCRRISGGSPMMKIFCGRWNTARRGNRHRQPLPVLFSDDGTAMKSPNSFNTGAACPKRRASERSAGIFIRGASAAGRLPQQDGGFDRLSVRPDHPRGEASSVFASCRFRQGLVLFFPAAEREKSSPSGCHTFFTGENTDPASLQRTGGVTSERVFLSQTLPLTFFCDVLKDTGIRMLANP